VEYTNSGRFGSEFLRWSINTIIVFVILAIPMIYIRSFIKGTICELVREFFRKENNEKSLELFFKKTGPFSKNEIKNQELAISKCINKTINYATHSIVLQSLLMIAASAMVYGIGLLIMNGWYLMKTGWGWIFS